MDVIRAMSNAELRQAIEKTLDELAQHRQDDAPRRELEDHLDLLLKVEAARATSITVTGEGCPPDKPLAQA